MTLSRSHMIAHCTSQQPLHIPDEKQHLRLSNLAKTNKFLSSRIVFQEPNPGLSLARYLLMGTEKLMMETVGWQLVITLAKVTFPC